MEGTELILLGYKLRRLGLRGNPNRGYDCVLYRRLRHHVFYRGKTIPYEGFGVFEASDTADQCDLEHYMDFDLEDGWIRVMLQREEGTVDWYLVGGLIGIMEDGIGVYDNNSTISYVANLLGLEGFPKPLRIANEDIPEEIKRYIAENKNTQIVPGSDLSNYVLLTVDRKLIKRLRICSGDSDDLNQRTRGSMTR